MIITRSLFAVAVAAILTGPLLAGLMPFGDDPVLLYQPIKRELSRALAEGRLPLWSDRIGLGIPLAAESHVAAFYPPNWLFYRFWDVATAYRLSMGVHLLALLAATFAYARSLGISHAGSAMSMVSFALCGFQASHVIHEPFYHAMPWLVLCLLCAEGYAKTGRLFWLAALALSWGAQITLGHFQIQMWTAGLVLLTGSWRALSLARGKPRPLGRVFGLVLAVIWGAAVAWVQIRLTWELMTISSFARPPEVLREFALPVAQCGQFALPEIFLGRPGGTDEVYWTVRGASAGESVAYVGVVPFLLAFVGVFAARRASGIGPWRLIAVLSLALATMPGWWPEGYGGLLQIPGLGWFRAPGRYTLLTSLALALLAGRGLDESIVPGRFWRFWGGLGVAIAGGVAALCWSIHSTGNHEFTAAVGAGTLPARFAAAGVVWALGLAAIMVWRRTRRAAWAPLGLCALELGVLFYAGPIQWGRPVYLPDQSEILRRLAALPDAGLIGGGLMNLPLWAGRAIAYPTIGIIPPPPNYLLEPAMYRPGKNEEIDRRWQRRFGVTHSVWGSKDPAGEAEVLEVVADPVLDQLLDRVAGWRTRGLGPWKLVRHHDVFPPAWIARSIHEAAGWGELYSTLSLRDERDVAWFIAGDAPPQLPAPTAQAARLESWDGQTAVVEHDGSCILIIRRTFYPGWYYQVDGGPLEQALKVDGGLTGASIAGSGTSRVTLSYRAAPMVQGARVSLFALVMIAVVLCASGGIQLVGRRSKAAGATSGRKESSQ